EQFTTSKPIRSAAFCAIPLRARGYCVATGNRLKNRTTFPLRFQFVQLECSHPRPHSAGVEHAVWIETLLYPSRQGSKPRVLWRKNFDGGPYRRGSANERCVAAGG